MKQLFKKTSETVLVVSNLVPLLGALFLGWDIKSLVLIYWCESAVVGIFNVVKMVKAPDEGIIKFILTPFFIIHYGLFMGVHLVFIKVLFHSTFSFKTLFLPVLAMALSHGYSLLANHFKGDIYKTIGIDKLMIAPYKRIVIMHLTVLVGGTIFMFLTPFFPSVTLPAVFLSVVKAFVDWKSHNREHFNIFKALDGVAENKKIQV